MRLRITLVCACILSFGSAVILGQAPKAKRINRAIELLSQGQPVYFAVYRPSTESAYEAGLRDSKTFADFIAFDMEHSSFDVKGLGEYMRGLVAGGTTKSGHRTPAVIAIPPVAGTDEATIRANAWMFNQMLATGIHGVMLPHADTPGAVRAFIESVRFPFHTQEVGKRLPEGRRGAHGSESAAKVWGVTEQEYLNKADAWPLNPEGELILGLKLEDKYALANVEEIAQLPGIAWAEWGPGDMGPSLGIREISVRAQDPRMLQARARILSALKANKIFFQNVVTPTDVVDRIKEGVMVGAGASEATAEIGRKYTTREMPWK